MKTETLAVMFTDIVGFTQKTSRQTHAENAELLRQHARVVHPLVRQLGGKVVKEIGDAVLATFASPTRAVEAAMAIQDRLVELNEKRETERQLHLRIAINVGEVRVERGDVFGEGVNVASRIEAETPVDEIYISGATYLTMNRTGTPFEFLGQRTLKGISEPVTVFKLPRYAANDDTTVIQTTRRATLPYGGRQLDFLAGRRRRRAMLACTLAAAVLAVSGVVALRAYENMQVEALQKEVKSAVMSQSWRRAADAIVNLRERGIEVDEASDAVLLGLAASARYGRACSALEMFDELFVNDSARHDAIARLRVQHAFGLLSTGELAQAEGCLEPVAFASTSPDGRMLELNRIHLAAVESSRARAMPALRKALKRYEAFLRAGSAPDEHLALIAEIAAEAYLVPKARPVADSLVLEYLGERAAQPLADRIVSPTTPNAARNWMVARLETIAQNVALDWPAIYTSQLDDRSCTARRMAVERLRRLGRLNVAGLLLREADKNDRCTRDAARAAVADLVANGDASLPSNQPLGPVLMASR